MVQTRFSPTQAEYCSGRMLILFFLRAWLSFFLLYMGTMSLFGPRRWRTLCENSSVVGPRSPNLTTNTDSVMASQDQVHGCKVTALLPHSAINTGLMTPTILAAWPSQGWRGWGGLLFSLCFYLVEVNCPPSIHSTLET